ncbi:hypothetical protein GCM10010160_52180 [Acrocarpospora corrugata]
MIEQPSLETQDPPETLDSVHEALARLTAEIKRDHDRATHREEIIDRLHADNRDLRHGLLQEALTPVRAGLYRLYDMANREAARLRTAPGDGQHVGALLAAVADEVAEILARTGAELLETAPGDPYDQARHRPAGTEDGPDGQVVTVLADGFRLGERVLRKAEVTVGRPAAPPETQQREDA